MFSTVRYYDLAAGVYSITTRSRLRRVFKFLHFTSASRIGSVEMAGEDLRIIHVFDPSRRMKIPAAALPASWQGRLVAQRLCRSETVVHVYYGSTAGHQFPPFAPALDRGAHHLQENGRRLSPRPVTHHTWLGLFRLCTIALRKNQCSPSRARIGALVGLHLRLFP